MEKTKLLCGYADMEITPKRPVYLDGFAARSEPSVGVRDPLYAKALMLKDAFGTECLILVFDVLGFDAYLSKKIRDAALSASGLSDENVMILSTHTHSGLASGGLYALPKDEEHWTDVVCRIGDLVDRARKDQREVSLSLDEAEIKIGMNRRAIVDGKVVIGMNPDKMRDDSLRVLSFASGDKTVGALANTSCHPVNLSAANMRVSADYPSVLHAYAREKEDFFAIFTNSACGNINPLRPYGDDEEANVTACGNEVVKTLENLLMKNAGKTSSYIKISCYAKDALLPLQRTYDEATLKEKYEYWNYHKLNDTDKNSVYRATVYSNWYAIQLAEIAENKDPSVNARVRLFELGDVAILSLPFETFVETRNALCDAYTEITGKRLIVCGCADRVFAYLPDPLSLSEGGYETEGACAWYAVPGKYTQNSEPALVFACKELFAETVK